jgi:acyl carrier protein
MNDQMIRNAGDALNTLQELKKGFAITGNSKMNKKLSQIIKAFTPILESFKKKDEGPVVEAGIRENLGEVSIYEQQFLESVIKNTADQLNTSQSAVISNTLLDLGVDSLDVVEIIMMVEDELALEIDIHEDDIPIDANSTVYTVSKALYNYSKPSK